MIRQFVFAAWVVLGSASVAVAQPAVVSGEPAATAVDPELEAAAAAAAAEVAAPGDSASPGDVATGVGSRQMNPDLSLILDSAAGAFSRQRHVRQGGHAIDENGLRMQGLELVASANVDPYFRFDMAVQLTEMEVEEAALTTLALPGGLQARAGYLNVPFGRENPRHLHAWSFANPSLAHSRFLAQEHFSGAGAELSVLLPLPFYLLATANAVDPHEATGLRSATFGTVESSASGRLDGLEDLVYVGRLASFHALSDDWSLALGTSASMGQSALKPDDTAALWGADLYLKWRPVSSGDDAWALALTAEYLARDTQAPGGNVRDHGGYAELNAWLGRLWMASLRGDLVGHVSGPAPAATELGIWQRRTSVALTWLPTHFSKLRLQTDWGQGEGDRPYFASFVQVEVSAGEHGAHAF
jgi:hypothetical protein